MSRVPNLLPTTTALPPETSGTVTTGRDFDDVLARTYQERRPDAAPKREPQRRAEPQPRAEPLPRPEQLPRAEPIARDQHARSGDLRAAGAATALNRADRPKRADRADGADDSAPDPAAPVAGMPIDPALAAAAVITASPAPLSITATTPVPDGTLPLAVDSTTTPAGVTAANSVTPTGVVTALVPAGQTTSATPGSTSSNGLPSAMGTSANNAVGQDLSAAGMSGAEAATVTGADPLAPSTEARPVPVNGTNPATAASSGAPATVQASRTVPVPAVSPGAVAAAGVAGAPELTGAATSAITVAQSTQGTGTPAAIGTTPAAPVGGPDRPKHPNAVTSSGPSPAVPAPDPAAGSTVITVTAAVPAAGSTNPTASVGPTATPGPTGSTDSAASTGPVADPAAVTAGPTRPAESAGPNGPAFDPAAVLTGAANPTTPATALGSAMDSTSTVGPTPATLNASSGSTGSPSSTGSASGPASSAGSTASAIDPGAAVLAGVYGVGRPGSSANQPTDSLPDAGAPAGSAGAIGTIGDRPNGITLGSERHGSDTPDQSQDQGGRQSASLSPGGVTVVPATSAITSPGAVDQAATASTPTGTPVTAAIGVTGPLAPVAAAAETSSGSNPSPRTSEITDQVMAQVGRQLQGVRLLRDGTHHTVLRLSPEHLGDVTITLDVRAGGIRLDLAAGAQALVALQADLSQLRDDLAGSGLDLGEVTLSSQNAGPGTNGQAASRERWQEQASAGRESGSEGSPRFTERTPDRPFTRTTDGGLDVLV